MAGDLDGGKPLSIAPSWTYFVKAGLTRSRSCAWLARTRGRLDTSGLRILTYHRIADGHDELAVSPSRFRSQMAFLAENGYRGVTIDEAADIIDRGDPVERVIGLTFDDGYLDNAEHALPVLEEHGFSATVFIAPGLTSGTTRPTWYSTPPPFLSWDEVVELDRGSVLRFEAHTLTHPNLLSLGEQDARNEIAGSKLELEERLGRSVSAFCYPANLFADRERRLVAEAGYRIAVSTFPGVNTCDTDRLALWRIQIDPRDRLLDFRAKVGGGHDSLSTARTLARRARYGAGSLRFAKSRR
jgi:peptidoglycan/xylan/chitin deacetylase (PgdA/CDA1 family)